MRIAPFPAIWLILAQVFLISDYAAAGSFSDVPDTAIELDLTVYLFASLAVALVGGLVGAVELFFLNRRLAARSLGMKLVLKSLFYAALLTAVILTTFPIAAALEMGTGLTDERVWTRLLDFLWSKTSLATAVQLATSLFASLFYSEISEHMGPRVLRNFITGRYHTPKEEQRIFLFSDMKSSTAIAEQLGHVEYFDFLRAYYQTFSDSIIRFGGEVYQYVGDEIVVSWPEERGLKDGNCVRCVLQMKSDLIQRAPEFERRFGIRPDFKAGLQTGPVTTGEIGALKKEIVFTGDVLNQTARIQSLCSTSGADVLIGDVLRERLSGRVPTDAQISFRSLGVFELRGRDEPVAVFALE